MRLPREGERLIPRSPRHSIEGEWAIGRSPAVRSPGNEAFPVDRGARGTGNAAFPSRLLKKEARWALASTARAQYGFEERRSKKTPDWREARSDRVPSAEGPFSAPQAASVNRFRIRTRLYTVAAKVNIQPTRSTPLYRVLRISPTVFSQPKISSTRLRTRWLTL